MDTHTPFYFRGRLDFSEETKDTVVFQETLLSSLAKTSTENIFNISNQLSFETKLWSWLSM